MMVISPPQPSGAFEWAQAPWGRVLRCRPLFDVAGHFFTAADLRLDAGSAEWGDVAALAGVDAGRLLLLHQVHGAAIVVARPSGGPWTPPQADGVLCDDGDAAVGVRVADCAPILVADRRRPAVAAVHAGWRSTMRRIGPAAVERMAREFGSRPGDLVAAIGPSLGPCCGEMGEEVVDAFRSAGHEPRAIDRWFVRTGGSRPHFDLWAANAEQLRDAGVDPSAIHVSGLCTRTHAAVFHSYRAAGTRAGRMVAVIRPRPE
jgi:YfiH family protein